MTNISDVARHAGVSIVTVSRVINGEKNVKEDTRLKVEQAIAELGYLPNLVARSLRSKRTHSVALIVPDITNVFWTTVGRGVEDVAQSQGYSVLLCNTDENPAKQARYLQLMASQRVDGVIIAPYDSDADHVAELRDRAIPTVIVDRRVDGWDVDSVRGDSIAGAEILVRHLLFTGHRRIGMISGPAQSSTALDRIEGYRRALAEFELPYDERLVRHGEFRKSSGEQLTFELLNEGLRPTAIFAANNAIALGVVAAVIKRGLRIPHDLALVCYDDLPEASQIFPFLTVMAQPAYEMGTRAAQILFDRLAGRCADVPCHVVLPASLIVRHSCGSQPGPGGTLLSLPLGGGG